MSHASSCVLCIICVACRMPRVLHDVACCTVCVACRMLDACACCRCMVHVAVAFCGVQRRALHRGVARLVLYKACCICVLHFACCSLRVAVWLVRNVLRHAMIVSRFTLHAASCILHVATSLCLFFWRVPQRPLRRMATQSHTPASSPRILGPRRRARRTLPSRRVRMMPRS
jgi:hypothetical protein